jgi:hypothetical protein
MLCGFPYATVTVRVGANAFAPAAPRPDRDKGGDFISLRLDIPPLPAAAPLSVSLPIEVLSPPYPPPYCSPYRAPYCSLHHSSPHPTPPHQTTAPRPQR